MDKIELENYTKKLWYTKYITPPDEDWFIYKFFRTKKQQLPIEQQRKIIELKKRYFWEYIPETILCETQNWEYSIKQKYIKWKTLAETDISTLSTNTLWKLIDLIKKYIKYNKEQWFDMDITWYQYYPWNPSNIKKKLMNFFKINQNFLTSTNIMISDDWNVYMVDVCESSDSHLNSKIKNFFAKPFIKKTVFELEKNLQQRINYENENTNKELLETLDK